MNSRTSPAGTGVAPTTSFSLCPTERQAKKRIKGTRRLERSMERLFARKADDQPITRELEDLHEYQQKHDGDNHDIGAKTLITETNGEIAETAAADHARHGGIGNQRDRRHGGCGDEARASFWQQSTPNDLPG